MNDFSKVKVCDMCRKRVRVLPDDSRHDFIFNNGGGIGERYFICSHPCLLGLGELLDRKRCPKCGGLFVREKNKKLCKCLDNIVVKQAIKGNSGWYM